jgi:hypothetical protein
VRTILATLVSLMTIAAISAQAAPLTPAKADPLELAAPPPMELVRDDCGHGWHRTGWRDQWGRWHWGDCVPNGNLHPGWEARWDYPYPVWRGPSVGWNGEPNWR